MRRPTPRAAASIVVALLLALAVLAHADGRAEAAQAPTDAPGAASACAQPNAAQTASRAGLVVTFGAGDTRTYCIEFEEESISGLQLLQRSGLPLVTAGSGGLGGAVCKIDSVGCDNPNNCFCQCAGSPCSYWAYNTFADGAWKASPVGASTRVVRNGDIDGWAWGSGGSAGHPAVAGGICPTPAPTATQPPAATPATPSTAVPPEATATELPSTAQPPSTVEPPPTAPVTPAQPQPSRTPPATGGVLGATRVSATSTPAASAATPAITPRTGAIIGADEGLANAARSSRRTSAGGGRDPLPALIASGAVVLALAGTAAFITHRRRRADG